MDESYFHIVEHGAIESAIVFGVGSSTLSARRSPLTLSTRPSYPCASHFFTNISIYNITHLSVRSVFVSCGQRGRGTVIATTLIFLTAP